MNLNAHLENLRSKPDHVRKHIAFWSALGITAVIFAFWSASFTVSGSHAKNAVAQAVDKVDSPAVSLVASVGGFFGDIKDIIFGPRKVTYSEIEVSPGNTR